MRGLRATGKLLSRHAWTLSTFSSRMGGVGWGDLATGFWRAPALPQHERVEALSIGLLTNWMPLRHSCARGVCVSERTRSCEPRSQLRILSGKESGEDVKLQRGEQHTIY